MAEETAEPDFNALIPELPMWNGGSGIDIDAWIACVGNYEHAIAYARLFWPRFTIHEDCVLFADFSEESFRGFMESTRGDKRAVETVMNHWHILDIFPNVPTAPSREMVLYVGRLLRETWSAKLRRDFPARAVVVSFPEEYSEDLMDYEIPSSNSITAAWPVNPRLDAPHSGVTALAQSRKRRATERAHQAQR